MVHLCVTLARRSVRESYANLSKYFSRCECGGKQVGEKIVSFDETFARGTDHNHSGAQSDDRGGPVCRGIGMSQAAADSSFISHLNITNVRSAFRQQGANLFEPFR